jgi:hypothetical protein
MRTIATLAVAFALTATACSSDSMPREQTEPQASAPEAQPVPAEQPSSAAPPRQTVAPTAEPSDEKAVGTTAKEGVNSDAMVLVDFKDRIDKYLDIHKKAEKTTPSLKETSDPAKIQAGEEGLAASIRALRADAKVGDIFTPPIRDKFRRLLSPETKGEEGHDAKEILKDDAPAPAALDYKPNAKYPEGAALPTVPANFLLNLPTLPEEVEYRVIGKHLILRDTKANIIVDYIPNAIR